MSKTAKPTHPFTLILSGIAELSEDVCDALFEAGCADALMGIRDGVVFLDFDREASSFREAVLSAIAEVESAGIGVMVLRVEPDELVTMAEIAHRAERSRENIRQLATGLRGPGGFPPPVANLTKKSPIWKWADVASWFAEKKEDAAISTVVRKPLRDAAALRDMRTVTAAVNAILDLRRHVNTPAEAAELYRLFLEPIGRRVPPRQIS